MEPGPGLLEVRRHGAVVTLTGEVDLNTSDLLRSELARACPEATQRSRFLAVPRYERFRCSRICAAPHLPSGWRDRSSGDIP